MTKRPSEDFYDVIIIGAGLGGLVCGCYLAKAGMKVLICEQHCRPGGYCTSFTRQGFRFDAAAHSFGGYRPGGIVRKVAEDLGLSGRLAVRRFDPVDVVCFGDRRISFWADTEKTIDDISSAFPGSADSLRNFFGFLNAPSVSAGAEMRHWTFSRLLDRYFKDDLLKTMLAFPICGNGGLPPSRMSAFIGARIFREFLLDGGYYPQGGMQELPDALAARFAELGGTLALSCPVSRITVDGSRARGVVLADGSVVQGNEIVSAADSLETFSRMMDSDAVPPEFADSLARLEPSLSLFVLYGGVASAVPELPPDSNVWVLRERDLDAAYAAALRADVGNIGGYLVRSAPHRSTICAYFNIAYAGADRWKAGKSEAIETFLRIIEGSLVPGVRNMLVFRDAATPHTLRRYTRNSSGAAYGWACSPDQVGLVRFRKPPFLENLRVVGHWAMQGLGIPGVIYSGTDTAAQLTRRLQRTA